MRPFRRAGRGQEALPEGSDWLGDPPQGLAVAGWVGSGYPPGGLVGVLRPSWRVGRGREALSEGREWLEGPARGPRGVMSPFRRPGWSGSPARGGRLFRRSGSGR